MSKDYSRGHNHPISSVDEDDPSNGTTLYLSISLARIVSTRLARYQGSLANLDIKERESHSRMDSRLLITSHRPIDLVADMRTRISYCLTASLHG